MPSSTAAKPQRLLRLRPLHIALLLAALTVPLALTSLAGGSLAFAHIKHFPVSLLLLMIAIAVLCWNLNAARLRLMLNGRAGQLGQGKALEIELASKFALCATPGGSGGAATLLLLLDQRGISPAKGTAIFLVDQGCDLTFFIAMLSGVVMISLTNETHWPHQTIIQLSLIGLTLLALSMSLIMAFLPRLLRSKKGWLIRLSAFRRRWLARRLLRCRHALKVTLALPRLTLIAMLVLTTAHWLLRYSLLYLAVLGVGGNADWLWTFLTQMMAMAASQFSFLPGGAGVAEIGVGSLLLPLMEQEQVAAAVLIWRLISYHLYLAAGAPFFILCSARLLRSRPLEHK